MNSQNKNTISMLESEGAFIVKQRDALLARGALDDDQEWAIDDVLLDIDRAVDWLKEDDDSLVYDAKDGITAAMVILKAAKEDMEAS